MLRTNESFTASFFSEREGSKKKIKIRHSGVHIALNVSTSKETTDVFVPQCLTLVEE